MYLTDGIGLDKSLSAPPFPLSKPRAPQIFWRKREECFVLTGEPKKGLALRAQASFLGDHVEEYNHETNVSCHKVNWKT